MGLTIDQALIAAEAFEPKDDRDARQKRNARYYEARKDRLKASEIKTIETTKTLSDGLENPPSPSPSSPPPMITKNSTPTTPPTTSSGNSTARGSRLPDGWRPDEAGRALASELLGNSGARAELEKFTDFWRAKAGADGRKLDWNATWRNWVRRAAERSPAQARASPRSGRFSDDPYVNALAEAVDHDRQKQFTND